MRLVLHPLTRGIVFWNHNTIPAAGDRRASVAILVYAETVRRARRIADIVNRAATAMRNCEQVQVTDTAAEFPEEFRRSTYSENHVKGSEGPGALASIRATADYLA